MWLPFLFGYVSIPIDMFTFYMMIFTILNFPDKKEENIPKIIALIISKAESLNYEIDLRKDEAFISECIAILGEFTYGAKTDGDAGAMPVPKTITVKGAGTGVNTKGVHSEGFSIDDIRKEVDKIKFRAKTPALTLKIK